MISRRTARPFLKWGGNFFCLLILLAWLLSLFLEMTWRTKRGWVGISYGLIHVAWFKGPTPPAWLSAQGPHVQYPAPGFLGMMFWLPNAHFSSTFTPCISIPLWIPFMCFALPSRLLWWRDRRRIPSGRCQRCGYNLTGNVSGLCPECGTAVAKGK